MYYLNARYYDPNDGRFITQDTYRGEINTPNTLHLYTYCFNNPINYVDPSGHMAMPDMRSDLRMVGYSCKGLGLYYTGEFLLHSLKNRPKNKYYSSTSNLTKDIKLQSAYKEAKRFIMKKCYKTSKKSFSITGKNIEFNRTAGTRKAWDMYLAIHGANYSVKCTKRNGRWSYKMKIQDRYDFEHWNYSKYKKFTGKVVVAINNYAECKQRFGYIKRYMVYIDVKDSF